MGKHRRNYTGHCQVVFRVWGDGYHLALCDDFSSILIPEVKGIVASVAV